MKRFARLVSLVVTLACFAHRPPLSLSAQSEPAVETLSVGDSVADVGDRADFHLDAEAGQAVTLRWEGRYVAESCDEPLEGIIGVRTEITNAEGDALEQIGLLHTPSATTQIYDLQGPGPYAVSATICGGSGMSLSVIAGDAVPRVEQPPLSIGETATVAATSVGPDQLLAFPLNVQVGEVFTVEAHFIDSARANDYPLLGAVVRDASGHTIPSDFGDRLPRELTILAPVYTVAGTPPYRLEFPALALYAASYVPTGGQVTSDIRYSVRLNPGNTAIEDRGLLAPGTPAQGIFPAGRPLLYTLDVEEGQTITFHDETVRAGSEYFFNADQDLAAIIEFGVAGAGSRNRVMRFEGPSPYTYYASGEGSYAFRLEEGDTIVRNALGTLAPGQSLRLTVPAVNEFLDYIALDVNPGTTITINWGVPQTEWRLRDSTALNLFPRNDQWSDGYAVYDLTAGTPPFIIVLDDARYAGQSYTFTLAEGETPLSPDATTAASASGNTPVTEEVGAQSETATDAGSCTVTAGSNINQRGGPGTTFDVRGTLVAGSSAAVDGQTIGADGFTWYRLTTGVWVRGDLVSATAGCSSVPEMAP